MKKNVGFLISNLAGGGAQRVVSNLSLGLSQYYNLYLILHDGEKIDYLYQGKLINLELPASNGVLKKIIRAFARVIKLRKLKKELSPTVVISFLESSNLVNLFSGPRNKVIVSVRSYKSKQANKFLGKIYNLLIKLLYGRSNYIVTPSKGIKFDLVNNFKLDQNKIIVIYNPNNLAFIKKESIKSLDLQLDNLFKNYPVVITVGSLRRPKGQWHLIRAFNKVKAAIPSAKLVILGEGELRVYLEEIVTNLGMQDDVYLLGFQSNPFRFISRASMFVLPSLYEGFPNVLVEAMACGVPVVAADCRSGPREILSPQSDFNKQADRVEYGEYGVLSPILNGEYYKGQEELSKEERQLAEATISLYRDTGLYEKYKVKGYERSKDFTLSKIVKQWIDLIEN